MVRATAMHSVKLESGCYVPCWCGVREGAGDGRIERLKLHVEVER